MDELNLMNDKTIQKNLEKDGKLINIFYSLKRNLSCQPKFSSLMIIRRGRKDKSSSPQSSYLTLKAHVIHIYVILLIPSHYHHLAIKRKIPLTKIKAITISSVGTEFVLHVPDEYDYRYSSYDK